jgi:DNA-binding XRE family transcriptional regulator
MSAKHKSAPLKTITMDGRDYVLVPVEDYEGEAVVDALAYSRMSLGKKLRAMRDAAGLTQIDLAQRLRLSQTMIAQAEGGKISVGEEYVAKVQAACRKRRGAAR